MAKASTPGSSKTRLVPLLTPEEAARCNTAFLQAELFEDHSFARDLRTNLPLRTPELMQSLLQRSDLADRLRV